MGIKEVVEWSSGQEQETRFYSPFPVPFRSRVTIRYPLASDEPAMLQAYDGVGRLVRSWAVQSPTWASNHRRPSATSFVTWDGRDAHGRELANGVHFVRLTVGDYSGTEKLVLQR